MSDSALKLSHIFGEAGVAFDMLSELTRQLQFMNDKQPSSKWTDEEIAMLRSCVHRFAVDLNELSLHIKNKTIEQIKKTLRKKAFEDAGIPLPEERGAENGAESGVESVAESGAESIAESGAESGTESGAESGGESSAESVVEIGAASGQKPHQLKQKDKLQQPLPNMNTRSVLATNPEVTLNMLNATGAEPEEAVGMDLEFSPLSGDDVAT